MTYCILKTSAQQTSSKSLHCYRGVSLPSPCIVCAEGLGLSTKCRMAGWRHWLTIASAQTRKACTFHNIATFYTKQY